MIDRPGTLELCWSMWTWRGEEKQPGSPGSGGPEKQELRVGRRGKG